LITRKTVRKIKMEAIKTDLIEYLSSALLVDFSSSEVTNNTNLFQSKLIDSYGLVELVGYLEEKYNFRLSISEITNKEFSSVSGIATILEHRISGGGE